MAFPPPFLYGYIQRSHCYDQDVAYYAHSALAVVSSVLYQSLGPCVQEVRESCLGLPQSGLHLVSMCPAKQPLCRDTEKAVKSAVFDVEAEGVLAECYMSMEVEMLLMCPSHNTF